MDEITALKILQKDSETEKAQAVEDQKNGDGYGNRSEMRLLILGAIYGFLAIIFLYAVLVHPIDKINLQMALTDSYAITTKVQGTTREVLVDGNLIYSEGKYYEAVDDGVYIYQKNDDGKWIKYFSKSFGSDMDTEWVADVFNKENYKRNILFWKPMEYKGAESILGMENVRTRVLFGKCSITGTLTRNGFFGITEKYYVIINIDQFGLVKLTLPEV